MSDRGQPSASGRNVPPDILRRKVSFGLELEFLVPWIRSGDTDPDQDIADDLAPILRIPDCDHVFEGAYLVRQAIRQVLIDAGLPVRSESLYIEEDAEAPALNTVPLVHTAMAEKFRTVFEVTADCSLREVDGLAGYHYTGVEVVSPAFWHDQHGLDMVRLAVSALANAYRLRLNPSCGFHVHVGAGMDRMIDSRTLRRYSAFLWASMPLLNSLHSPERMALHFSGSCRAQPCSLLGDHDGTGAAAALWEDGTRTIQARARCVGRDRWLGEPYDLVDDPSVREVMATEIWDEEPWEENIALSNGINGPDLPGRLRSDEVFMAPASSADPVTPKFSPPRTVYPTRPLIQSDEPNTDPQERRPGCAERQKDSPDPPRPRQPAIQRRIPHVPFIMTEPENEPVVERRMAFYEDKQIASIYESSWFNLKRHDVMSGVRELLAGCMSSCLPGSMMGNSFSSKCTGTNFYAYTPEKFTYMPFQSRATVEIRMGSPSICPDWVPTWASICARILTWCRDVSDVDFMRVIRLLAWAQEEGGQYDVIDLLIDIGAYEETRVAEARLSREVDGRHFDLDNIRGWEECPAPAEVFLPVDTPAYEASGDDGWGGDDWGAAPDSDITSHAHHPGDFWGPRPDLIYDPPASDADADADANDEGEEGEDWGEEFPLRPRTADGVEGHPGNLSGGPPKGEQDDGLDEVGLPNDNCWGSGWEPEPATAMSDEEEEHNTPEYDSPENWPTERVLFPASK